MEREKLISSKAEKFFYSLGGIGNILIWTVPSSFLVMYYTDSVGMSAAYIGTMMLICRLFDGLSDVIMGILIDKTHTRWGKVRPWLLMAIPLLISVILVFYVPSSLSDGGKQAYTFITYFLMSVIFYTAVNMAISALPARISLSSQDRNVLAVVSNIIMLLCVTIVSMIIPSIIMSQGGFASQHAWTITIGTLAVVSSILILLSFFGVREKISVEKVEKAGNTGISSKVSTKQGLKVLLSNKYFYIGIVLFLVYNIVNGMAGVNIYYARDVLNNTDAYGLISMVGLLPAIILMPFAPLLFKKIGKRNTMSVGFLLAAAASATMLINPYNTTFFLVMSLVRSIGTMPVMAGVVTLTADIVDYNYWKTGTRTEGITSSVASVGMKLGTGIGSALLGWLLAWGQYDGTLQVQHQPAINAMIIMAIVVPIIIYIIAFIVLRFWDLEKYLPQIEAFAKENNPA